MRPPPEGIDPRRAASRWHFGRGWSAAETDRRWAEGGEAVLWIQLKPGVEHRLRAEVAPYAPLPVPQTITVVYAGVAVATWQPPDSEWRQWSAEIPNRLVTGGIDELRFRFAAAARPIDTEPWNPDPRRLAAMFRIIRFEETPLRTPAR